MKATLTFQVTVDIPDKYTQETLNAKYGEYFFPEVVAPNDIIVEALNNQDEPFELIEIEIN
jgi:hypothetical protein